MSWNWDDDHIAGFDLGFDETVGEPLAHGPAELYAGLVPVSELEIEDGGADWSGIRAEPDGAVPWESLFSAG